MLSKVTPAREARTRPTPAMLSPSLSAALGRRGISELYLHQAEALERVSSGHDIVVATPTASGKSLCYHLPVLDALLRDPTKTALYLFPTKALSRDQESSILELMTEAGMPSGAVTYDGDTPNDARRAARERSAVLITNPDMLHSGILPHHASWSRFFARLAFVVVDELHSYRGVFGSHLANVLRRLRRVAQFHGAEPRFVLASATIANPKAHAERLVGRQVALIDENGAPSGPRRVIVYDPPILNEELGIRASTVKTAVNLTAELIESGVRTILFGQSRNEVEVMLKYLRDRLAKSGREGSLVQGYRGGYLPNARRRTEVGLRDGEVGGVVSTSALELGIDVGGLDAVVCAGYPGTMAGLWQRFGRAGRRSELSLALLVTSSAPIDQYLARSPELVTSPPIEEARIDPDNVEIFLQHVECSTFELPFETGGASASVFGDVPDKSLSDALGFLSDRRVIQPVESAADKTVWHWASESYPANAVSLRSAGWDNVVVIDVEKSLTLAEMDFRSAHTMLHEQAIYQHDAEQYQVETLDLPNKKAFVRKVRPDYYTTAMTHVKVAVLYEDQKTERASGHGLLVYGLGEVDVIEKVVGFKKIKYHTHENVGYGEVHLPEMQLPTTAFWLAVAPGIIDAVAAPRSAVIDALRGLSYALHGVAAVGLMTDPRDLAVTVVDDGEADPGRPRFAPTIYLYDRVAGGVGLAERLYVERDRLIERAVQLVGACPCSSGCPSCVGPVSPGSNRKSLALTLVERAGLAMSQA